MLEVYQLKQQYHALRQELSNALYENDAAKRVIARLIKERDEARQSLESVEINGSSSPKKRKAQVQEMDVDQVDSQVQEKGQKDPQDQVIQEIESRATLYVFIFVSLTIYKDSLKVEERENQHQQWLQLKNYLNINKFLK